MNPSSHREEPASPKGSAESDANSAPDNGFPAWKRALDLTGLVLLLPGAVVLGLGIACAIKCASPGPVLFQQTRIGYRRQRFIMLKFRTMERNADPKVHERHVASLIETNQPMRKADDDGDPRVYPLGRFLRHTGLDELPQLWNVLRGEMSLVGPRPCTEAELPFYEAQHNERFSTPPGLTGLWQVCGKNDTTFKEMVMLDSRYVRERSLWLDLKIICQTPGVLLKQTKKWWLDKGNGKAPSAQAPSQPTAIPASPQQRLFKVVRSAAQLGLGRVIGLGGQFYSIPPQLSGIPPC